MIEAHMDKKIQKIRDFHHIYLHYNLGCSPKIYLKINTADEISDS